VPISTLLVLYSRVFKKKQFAIPNMFLTTVFCAFEDFKQLEKSAFQKEEKLEA